MADNQKAPESKFVPPSQVDPAALAEAFEKEGLVSKPPPAATSAPAEPPKVEEKKPEAPKEEIPALLRIAKERDAFRKEMEQAKPYVEMLKSVPPQNLAALARAMQNGDPVSLLAAAGFTHAQYTARLLGEKDTPPAEVEQPKNESDSLVKQLQKKIEDLESERQAEKAQSARTQFLSRAMDLLKDDPKFPLIVKLGDVEGVEGVILQYHREHGTLPGATFEESVRLAAEVYEGQLRQKAEKWKSVLTPSTDSAPLGTKAPESPKPSSGFESPRTLTNANTSAPAPVREAPKTRQELIQHFIEKGTLDDLA